MRRVFVACLFACLLAPVIAPHALRAEDFPTRPIRLIIPLAPGGGADVAARVLAAALSETLGQQVIPENRPGAGVIVGSEYVASARPDGYTLLFGSFSHATNPTVQKSLPYDTEKAFEPVARIVTLPLLLAASPAVPANNLKSFIAYLKANPGRPFGSSGVASVEQLSAVLFAREAGVKVLHVPYRGEGPAIIDAIGNKIDFLFTTVATSGEYIKSGQLKGICYAQPTRTPELPNLPTCMEAGLPHFTADTWFVVLAPAGTPAAIVTKLNQAINQTMAKPAVQKKFKDIGYGPIDDSTPQSTAAFLAAQTKRWHDLIEEAGIKLQ